MPKTTPKPLEAAILFADIAGSSSLYESAGDAAALAAVSRCIQSLKSAAADTAGIVVKTIGDGMLCRFRKADDALLAAIAMQARVAGGPLGVRIGVHFGPVVLADDDVFGDSVNLAARIVDLANPGQILTSRPTYEALPAFLKGSCRQLYSTRVKGRTEEVTIFEVVPRRDEGLTMLAQNDAATLLPGKLVIVHRDSRWELGNEGGEIQIGRDATNDVTVPAATASRHHAIIASKKGKFVLTDKSSNGTYVALENGQDILLRREEFILTGRGRIGLGAPPDRNSPDSIGFEVS